MFLPDDAVRVAALSEYIGRKVRDATELDCLVRPADVAALAVHFMTSTALTGATYDIDGGQHLVEA